MLPLQPGDPEYFGRFRTVGRLAEGGRSSIFLAEDGSIRVAVKTLHQAVGERDGELERFARGAEAMRSVRSSHVAKVIDFNLDGEVRWLATEYVSGFTLKEHVERFGPLSSEAWFQVFEELSTGLEDIHRAGVIHRDVKPSNVVLSPSGAKIIDFDIAHASDATSVTVVGEIAGTLEWSSPEQIEGGELQFATDLFSLGSTMAFAGQGRSPWRLSGTYSAQGVISSILMASPDLAGLSDGQRQLVTELLHKDPQIRFIPALVEPAIDVEEGGEPRSFEFSYIYIWIIFALLFFSWGVFIPDSRSAQYFSLGLLCLVALGAMVLIGRRAIRSSDTRSEKMGLAGFHAVVILGLSSFAGSIGYFSPWGLVHATEECEPPTTTTTSVSLVDVFFESDNSSPTVSFPTPLETLGTERLTLRGGSGHQAVKGSAVDFQVTVFFGATEEFLTSSSYDEAAPVRRVLDSESDDFFSRELSCVSSGERLVFTSSVEDVFGPIPEDEIIQNTSTIVTVVEVQKAYPPAAEGKPSFLFPFQPVVTTDEFGFLKPIVPNRNPPGELRVYTHVRGIGPRLADGDKIVVHYTGVVWETQDVFASSFDPNFPVTLTLLDGSEGTTPGVIKGVYEALKNARVGSRVVVVVPTDFGYPVDRLPEGVDAGATLVYVFDILGIE